MIPFTKLKPKFTVLETDILFEQVREDLETEKPRNEEVTEEPRQIEIFPNLVESSAVEKTLVSTI